MNAEGGMGNAESKKEKGGQRPDDRGQKVEVGGHGAAERFQVSGVRCQGLESMEQGVACRGKSRGRNVLTEKGRLMARIPLDPRLSRMLIEAKKEGCVDEMTIIVAALSIQDPRERPVEMATEADRVHATFQDVQSDFVTLLNIWHRYHRHQQMVKSNNQMKRFCREHFLSFMRMREWRDIHQQISLLLKEHGFRNGEGGMWNAEYGSRKAE